MTKREKVESALKLCRWHYEDYEGYWPNEDYNKPLQYSSYEYVCSDCPYYKGNDGSFDDCLNELHEDALKLLERAGCFLEEGLHYFPCGKKLVTDNDIPFTDELEGEEDAEDDL